MSFGEPLDLKAGPPRWLWPILVMMAGLAVYAVLILSIPLAARLFMIILLAILSGLMFHSLSHMGRYRLLVGRSGIVRLHAVPARLGIQVVSGLDHVWLSSSMAMLLVRTNSSKKFLLLAGVNNDPEKFRRFSVWLRYAQPELAGP